MWKSLALGLSILLHSGIFLVSMCNYKVRSPLFIIKTVGLDHVPRQSYSQNSHGSYTMKPIITVIPKSNGPSTVSKDCDQRLINGNPVFIISS